MISILRRIGNTEMECSPLGLGLWSVVTPEWGADVSKAEEVVRYALKSGITLFDTADLYAQGKAEELLGRTLSTKRGEVIIITKIGYNFYEGGSGSRQDFSPKYLEFALKKSLHRLRTDYIDVLMLHNPRINVITSEEVLQFMTSLKRDGIVRAIGIALGPTLGWREEGLEAVRRGYEAIEHIYNLIERWPGEEILEHPEVGNIVRVPHASDVLDEERWPLRTDPLLHRSLKSPDWIQKASAASLELKSFAEKKGMKLYELAIKFILSNPSVSSVIPNIISPHDVQRFVKALDKPDLNIDDLNELNLIYENRLKLLNRESILETSKYLSRKDSLRN